MLRIGHPAPPQGKPKKKNNPLKEVAQENPLLDAIVNIKMPREKVKKEAKSLVKHEEEFNEEEEAIALGEELFALMEQENEAARCAKLSSILKKRENPSWSTTATVGTPQVPLSTSTQAGTALVPPTQTHNDSNNKGFIMCMLLFSLFFYVCGLHPIAIIVTMIFVCTRRYNVNLNLSFIPALLVHIYIILRSNSIGKNIYIPNHRLLFLKLLNTEVKAH
jgi:hypothetical protein